MTQDVNTHMSHTLQQIFIGLHFTGRISEYSNLFFFHLNFITLFMKIEKGVNTCISQCDFHEQNTLGTSQMLQSSSV